MLYCVYVTLFSWECSIKLELNLFSHSCKKVSFKDISCAAKTPTFKFQSKSELF
jgi:hypothetical protein